MLAKNVFINTEMPTTPIQKVDGVLDGKRLAVKDLFHVTGIPTSAGNPDWLRTHSVPKQTNSTVEKLLRFGAQYVGKSVTDELAYSLNGQNNHYGTPMNVLSPERLPGGSSSGSAVAVAADMADIGLGTDTGGSIRVPASYNGLFGLRPSHGAIAMDNMVPLAPSFDTVGWVTRTLDELHQVGKLLLPESSPLSTKPICGVLDKVIDTAAHKPLINQWISGLSLDTLCLSEFDPQSLGLSEAFRVLQGYEIWQQHGDWFKHTNPTMADDIRTRFLQCELITAEHVATAQQVQNILKQQLEVIFTTCDVLVLPTTPGIAPLLTTSSEALAEYRQFLLSMTAIAGLAGLPQLHLPLFNIDGAACGVSLIGPRGSDMTLIELAQRIVS